MSDKIGLQLYTVREMADKNYEATIRQVAEIGYKNVETAGFPGTTPEAAGKLFKALGLTVVAAHSPMPIGDKKQEVLDTMRAIDCTRVICPWYAPDGLKTVDGVKVMCEQLNQAAANAQAAGMTFGYHNHHAEFEMAEEQYVYRLMMEYLDPSVFFEVDTYWVKVAGLNPIEVIQELGKRAALLHIKDGPVNHTDPMTALGEGVMDIPGILKAGGENALYWIMEADAVAGDAMVEVKKSYAYLKRLA